MGSMYDELEVAATQNFQSSSKRNGKLMPEWDINVWYFGDKEEKNDGLERYLKGPILVLSNKAADAQGLIHSNGGKTIQ